MLTRINIENFRGFKKLELNDCKKFNLVLGKNNVGKTALLEALFLHIGSKNPELISKINAFRGIFPIPLKIESLWNPLFYNYDSSKIIFINSDDSNHKTRRLEIKLASINGSKILQQKEKKDQERETSITTSTISQNKIELKYYDPSNNYSSSFAIMEKEGSRLENSMNSDLQGIFVFSQGRRGGSEDAERYADLDVKRETSDIINILQKVEPRLRRLSVVPQGSESNVYGDIGISRSIPIQLMGEGTSKLLSLSLAITVFKNGIVLIDEVENGLHYSIMREVFSALKELAKKYNVQIFATTHSNECVHALYESYGESDPDDISFIRLDRVEGEIKSVNYDKRSLDTIFETGWEIRG